MAVLVGLNRLGGVWVRRSPRANAASARALLAEARAKRLERVEGAVRVVNDVR